MQVGYYMRYKIHWLRYTKLERLGQEFSSKHVTAWVILFIVLCFSPSCSVSAVVFPCCYLALLFVLDMLSFFFPRPVYLQSHFVSLRLCVARRCCLISLSQYRACCGFPSTLIIGRYAFTVTTPLVTHRQLQTADSRVTQMIASRVATQRVNKTAGCFVSSSSEKCRKSSIFLIFRQPGALFFFCAGVSGVNHYQCSCSTVSCRVGAPTSQRDEERPIFVSPSKLSEDLSRFAVENEGSFLT